LEIKTCIILLQFQGICITGSPSKLTLAGKKIVLIKPQQDGERASIEGVISLQGFSLNEEGFFTIGGTNYKNSI
jgi:hypothetical protein